MRTKIALSLLLFVCTILNAQNCNIQGIVQYEYNDYVGYKIDAGAEIGVISLKNANEIGINVETWNKYEKLAKSYMSYLDFKNDDDTKYVSDSTIRDLLNWQKKSEDELKNISKECFSQYLNAVDNFEYIALVDASGKYTLSLPYGEYVIIAKSKHRERPLVTELTGRILVEKVKIEKPAKIISFDFCY